MKDIHDQHADEINQAQTAHNAAISEAMKILNDALDAANNRYADALHASREKLQNEMNQRLRIWRGECAPTIAGAILASAVATRASDEYADHIRDLTQ